VIKGIAPSASAPALNTVQKEEIKPVVEEKVKQIRDIPTY
jgi:hypothetical protein